MKPVAVDWFQREQVAPDLMPGGNATATLAWPEQDFNVDACFSELIDNALGCAPEDCATSMDLLARLAPGLVHPGHCHSFDTQRMQALVADDLAGRRAPGCPALE